MVKLNDVVNVSEEVRDILEPFIAAAPDSVEGRMVADMTDYQLGLASEKFDQIDYWAILAQRNNENRLGFNCRVKLVAYAKGENVISDLAITRRVLPQVYHTKKLTIARLEAYEQYGLPPSLQKILDDLRKPFLIRWFRSRDLGIKE